MELQIFGLIVATITAICGTLLGLKRMEIAFQERKANREIEAAEKNRRQEIWENSTAYRWESLYEEEKQRRITQETINAELRKTIQRNEELLGRVKVADL